MVVYLEPEADGELMQKVGDEIAVLPGITHMQFMSKQDVLARLAFAKKKSGTPTSAAAPKQITCRLVSPNRTLLCIRLRSFGIVT